MEPTELHNASVDPDTLPETGKAEELVVLLHGALSTPESLDGLVAEVRRLRPDAALMRPRYGGKLSSPDDVFDLSSQLEQAIHEAQEEYGFRRILLVGHSAGALLLRKAYIYGRGSTEDRPGWPRTSPERPWAKKVKRIILIAGMNRGWSIQRRSKHVPLWLFIVVRMLNGILRAAGVGTWGTNRFRMVRNLEQGAPFVANMRIQWVRLSKRPPVVQLLGDIDRIVSNKDQRDLLVDRDFVFIPVVGSDHGNIINFPDPGQQDPPPEVERRRVAFEEALTEPVSALRNEYQTEPAAPPDPPVERIVFLLHGIRDYGLWTHPMREILRASGDGRVRVVTPRYRYFPMLLFLLLSERQKNVRWFMDEYTEQLALTWPADEDVEPPELHFLGHSNGTYILASALSRYAAVTFDRVAFAGSVVPRSYPWDRIVNVEKRVKRVRNDIGSRDWVVAVFPRLFEVLHVADIGSGGFHGFSDTSGNEAEFILKGGHGVAIKNNEPNLRSIAAFLLSKDGGGAEAGGVAARRLSGFWSSVSKFCAFVWILLIGSVALGAVLLTNAFGLTAGLAFVALVLVLMLLV